jgi:hypothetical protein
MGFDCLHKPFFYFFTLLIFIQCTTDDGPTVPDNAVFVPQTELISLTGDANSLTLTWKPVVIDGFIRYSVYRFDSYTDANINQAVIFNSGVLVYETSDNLTTAYVDDEVPFNSFVHYAIVTEYIHPEGYIAQAISVNYLSYENEDLSFMVTSLEQLADGSLQLTWEEDGNNGFEKYTVAMIDAEGIWPSEEVFNNGTVLTVQLNQGNTSANDTNQYKRSSLTYAVSKVINGKTIYSKNSLTIANPRHIDFRPKQTFKNPYNDEEIILIDFDGSIVFYNVNSLSKTTISTNKENYFCSIEEYNGVYDLYVPISGGKVLVIDLVTHLVKETMTLNTDVDYNIISAIPINGNLVFLEKHRYADIGGMFVYNRATQTVLNRDGIYSMQSNSKLVYGQDNYFFSIWNDGLEYGTVSAIRKLNINGNTVTIDLLFSGSKTDSRLFALSDDKSYIVSTNLGFHSDVDYQNFTEVTTERYGQNQFFGDAKIFDNNTIYFALPNELQITVFEKNNFAAPINQYATSGIPLFLEVFDTTIQSINQNEFGYSIETIPK